jgi:hypothetical protein
MEKISGFFLNSEKIQSFLINNVGEPLKNAQTANKYVPMDLFYVLDKVLELYRLFCRQIYDSFHRLHAIFTSDINNCLSLKQIRLLCDVFYRDPQKTKALEEGLRQDLKQKRFSFE